MRRVLTAIRDSVVNHRNFWIAGVIVPVLLLVVDKSFDYMMERRDRPQPPVEQKESEPSQSSDETTAPPAPEPEPTNGQGSVAQPVEPAPAAPESEPGTGTPSQSAGAAQTPQIGASGASVKIDEDAPGPVIEAVTVDPAPEQPPKVQDEPPAPKPPARNLRVELALGADQLHPVCDGRLRIRFQFSALTSGASRIYLEVPMSREVLMNEAVAFEGCKMTFLGVEHRAGRVGIFDFEWPEE